MSALTSCSPWGPWCTLSRSGWKPSQHPVPAPCGDDMVHPVPLRVGTIPAPCPCSMWRRYGAPCPAFAEASDQWMKHNTMQGPPRTPCRDHQEHHLSKGLNAAVCRGDALCSPRGERPRCPQIKVKAERVEVAPLTLACNLRHGWCTLWLHQDLGLVACCNCFVL